MVACISLKVFVQRQLESSEGVLELIRIHCGGAYLITYIIEVSILEGFGVCIKKTSQTTQTCRGASKFVKRMYELK